MNNFFVRFKSYKARNLENFDSRVLCAHNTLESQHISEFKINIKSNIAKTLVVLTHDYLVQGDFSIINVPIVAETDAIIFNNHSYPPQNYVSYFVKFFNELGGSVNSVKIEVLSGRNIFQLKPPFGAKSFDYIINEDNWNKHHYDFGLECTICCPLSD